MFRNIKAIVFDLDGTIYYGNTLINGAFEIIEHFRKHGKKIYFLTNNSTKSRQQIYEKLLSMGLKCSIEEIYTSGYVAAIYAKKENIKNIFIFGSKNLKTEFELKGIEVTESENEAESLLIGYDTDLNYDKLTQALNIALRGKIIIACNKEKHYPGVDARIMPGCGAMVGAIELCANRNVDYVIGKPNTLMLDILVEENNLNRSEILMVGDTYESDIIMANKFGCKSILISKNAEHETTISNIKDIKRYIW